MIRIHVITLLLICCSVLNVNGQEQPDHLRKKISLNIEGIKLREALPKIGEAGNFQFSYNSSILAGDSIVSISAEENQVEDLLVGLLGEDIRYKVLGNHVILLPVERRKGEKPDKKIDYTLTGYIYDAISGEIISQASIYDVDERLVSATDQDGFYSINLPSGSKERYISYSKAGYNDTVIVIRPSISNSINISLVPKPPALEEHAIRSLPPGNIHDRTLVAAIVPGRAITASENIPVVEERFFQVSFLPFIGSNHVVSGLLTNKVSLNVLAGYSEGVRGVEVGSLLNIDRNDVHGVQLSGFGNIVGKDTRGVQLAGFFNVSGGSFTGLQASGFSNLVMDTIRGVQLAGFSNALRGPMYGPQISGFANFTSQNVGGTQLAGFSNIALGDVDFAQVSGFANVATGDVKVAQLSGFANYSRNVSGLQASGFANIASGRVTGLQASGFLNYATEVDGVQLSIFNISDTVRSGLPIGIMSFVLKGFHKLELSADELFYANASFKTGINRFYNIFTAGIATEGFRGGYGIGSRFEFGRVMGLSLDLTSSYVVLLYKPSAYQGFLLRFTPKMDVRIFKYLTITAGPSLNAFANFYNPYTDSPKLPIFFSLPLYDYESDNLSFKSWIGFSLGFRF